MRPITEPHSRAVAAARARGDVLPSASEEEALFFQSDRQNDRRLLQLLNDRAREESLDPAYRIGPDDQIAINVFDLPQLNYTEKVAPSGLLVLPLVGSVPALGRTEADLRSDLTRRLDAFVKDPQVSVAVHNYGSQKVAVLGAVNKPGTYALRKGSNTLLEILGEAGGVSERAGTCLSLVPGEAAQAVPVSAEGAGFEAYQSDSIEIPLHRVLGTEGRKPLSIPVRSGDAIIVPEAGKITVEGEVMKGGAYDATRNTTLMSILAAAGGITRTAKFDEVEVIRPTPAGPQGRLIIDLQRMSNGEQRDVPLRAGDIVRVPSDIGRRHKRDAFEAVTRMINFGIGGTIPMY